MIAYQGDRLMIEGVSAETLVGKFGSPLYVYSRATIVARLASLSAAFRARPPLICYALKANSNRSLCRLLAARGAGADIVSGGELLRALGAGFAPERIVFSGVGKTSDEMVLALKKRVLALNVESLEELKALEDVARRLKARARVAVRLNPDVDPRTHPHITTGKSENKFGVERAEALEMYHLAARSRWLRPTGIQCHIGSQITDVRPYRLAARSVARLVRELEGRGVRLEHADFGGGLGITYDRERPLDLRGLAEVLASALKPWPAMRLLLEPGRYLVADAGVLLTRVLYRKRTSRRRFVIVDAAMNDLARPALYDAYHPVWPARRRSARAETADVVGPVCETGDFLARGRQLPPCEPGDVLAVLKAGAYGFAMSSQYNSRLRAAEVLVEGGKVRLIRRRETLKDLVRHEL